MAVHSTYQKGTGMFDRGNPRVVEGMTQGRRIGGKSLFRKMMSSTPKYPGVLLERFRRARGKKNRRKFSGPKGERMYNWLEVETARRLMTLALSTYTGRSSV